MYTVDKECGSVLQDPFFGSFRSEKNMQKSCVNYDLLKNTEYENTPLRELLQYAPDKDTEMTINEWNIMSINEIMKHANKKFIDFAVQYVSMGHIIVLFYIVDTGNFAMRYDGGSNGYEREDYYITYNSDNYQPKTFCICSDEKITKLSADIQYTYKQLCSYLFEI